MGHKTDNLEKKKKNSGGHAGKTKIACRQKGEQQLPTSCRKGEKKQDRKSSAQRKEEEGWC